MANCKENRIRKFSIKFSQKNLIELQIEFKINYDGIKVIDLLLTVL